MRIEPNISMRIRIVYVALGVVLVLAPFVLALQGSVRWILPALGAVSVVAGAVGW